MSEETIPTTSDSSAQMGSILSSLPNLKRRASMSFGEDEEQERNARRKRFKEDDKERSVGPSEEEEKPTMSAEKSPVLDSFDLEEALAQELECGCCSALVYRPVVVSPCQHFFCGSCCVLWIKNGGTNCPACRGVSTIVTPSRPLQAMVDLLLCANPSRVRPERERLQADEIYKGISSMRIPAPREASPEPNLNISRDYAQPCPHCLPGNPFGWRCPQPIADPNIDLEHAWPLEEGLPPGHLHCGNCESFLAIGAPLTTKCDFCQVSFCGISVQGRCCALPIHQQEPHNMSDVGDLIQSADVYECFDSNPYEVEIMLDYLNTQGITPKHIFRSIVEYYTSLPQGFLPLFELDMFGDMWNVEAGTDQNPAAPRRYCCRMCAAEILLYGLRTWWARERKKGFLDESVTSRKDCPDGRTCVHQKDLAHAKEFNHIFTQDEEPQTASNEPAPDAVPEESLETSSGYASVVPDVQHTDVPILDGMAVGPDMDFQPVQSSSPRMTESFLADFTPSP